MNRREFVAGITAAGLAAAQNSRAAGAGGRLKQCVTTGVFGHGMAFEDMCRHAADAGAYGFDLIGPDKWPVLKKYGLVPTMMPPSYGGTIPDGINDPANHARIERGIHEAVDLCAEHKAPNVIVFSGSRRGMADEKGADNAVALLEKVKSHAEDKGVILCMELLNSKVNHKDYMCDKTTWGVELCKRLGSPNFKLLYDIYHMQIDEGDVIRTIQDNNQYIGHYHTGGVPGRHVIDESQELYYPAIMKAILATGFKDYVAQEFTSAKKEKDDKVAELKKAVLICDV